jgi:hypothetical protein
MQYQGNSSEVVKNSSSYILDNGAFTHWKKGKGSIDIEKYKDFVQKHDNNENYTWNFIPDIIDGSERANDAYLEKWFNVYGDYKSVPVWHYHESLERLSNLSKVFDVVALGSSADYSVIGTPHWHQRTKTIFNYYLENELSCKLHGLRMLNKKIFTLYPYYSGDSTNIARNLEFYRKRHRIKSRLDAAITMANNIEKHKSTYGSMEKVK